MSPWTSRRLVGSKAVTLKNRTGLLAVSVLPALSYALAALDTWARPALTVGLATSAHAMLVGLLSLGALLEPTVVAALIALLLTRPGANAPAAADEPQPSQQRGVNR